MKELTKSEEQVMRVIWDMENCFVRNILEALPNPRPAYNTVGSFLKILEAKGYVARKKIGNIYSYTPLITKSEYSKRSINTLVSKYFNGSPEKLLSFMADEQKLTIQQVENLLKRLKKND